MGRGGVAAGPGVRRLPHYGVFFATAGMFVVYEAIVSQFVEPLLYGARTGMSTIAVLASAVFWAWLWGPVGLLLSTPLTVILVVIGKYVPQLQFLDIMLGDEPVLEPPVRVYQRLLALDAEEAAESPGLPQGALADVFEEVLLPALALAEQDRHRGRLDDQRETFLLQTMRDLIENWRPAQRGKGQGSRGRGTGGRRTGVHDAGRRPRGRLPPRRRTTWAGRRPRGMQGQRIMPSSPR